MRRPLLAALAVLALLTAACDAGLDAGDVSTDQASKLSAEDTARILDLVNDPATDLALLDGAIGLDARAARSIAGYRTGPDGVMPSTDDRYCDEFNTLDFLPNVGDAAISKLRAYALAHPAPKAEVVENVTFRGWEAQAVIWGVNNDSAAALDALIDVRAAAGLVARRPFATVSAMAPVPYVASAALVRLRAHAAVWWTAQRSSGEPVVAGTFDGVTFDQATARVALVIANTATQAQLTEHGVTSSPATHIVAGRPYATLGAVSALSGVGTATMTALKAYAQSGAWPPPADCLARFSDAVSPHLASLLFMSESDRPLAIVTFPGQGGTAPTAASVLALVGGTSAELRDVANYYSNLEPADSSDAAAVQAAFTAQLTDVVYVAIHPAPTPEDPNSCDLPVYLVGRTACGDLVGIRSIAVET
jgi:hypothetical protein